jgi:peptidase C39-like protein
VRGANLIATGLAVASLALSCASPPRADRTPAPSDPPPSAPIATATPSLAAATPSETGKETTPPSVRFVRADLAGGNTAGVSRSDGALRLGEGLAVGTYVDPFGNGVIPYESGTWTSDWTSVAFPFDELVASWNAETPATTWLRIEMQASGAGRTTKWYTMAVWASGDGDVHRTSVSKQDDADGAVAFDTFVRTQQAAPLDAYRLQVTLHRKVGSVATPTVRLVTAMASATMHYDIPSAFAGTVRELDVPTYSQEIHAGEFPQYDGGGEAWCSPTSTAMVLGYWKTGPTSGDLAAFPGPAYRDPQVDHAARYTYDWAYRGAGNWPNNTAYAARFGLSAFVTRLRSLGEAELFINAGIPLVASITGKLPGLLRGSTEGHLLVIRGFTADGNVITNDPAAFSNPETRKVYGRADFEKVWLLGSAGTVYVIHPANVPLPANLAGLPPNW